MKRFRVGMVVVPVRYDGIFFLIALSSPESVAAGKRVESRLGL